MKTVSRGAALLDRRRPGWRGRIDLKQLDMDSFFHCILGQEFEDFQTGLESLWPNDGWEKRDQNAEDYGFEHNDFQSSIQLKAAWIALLSERRQGERSS